MSYLSTYANMKILMISDYCTPLWWIEQYIVDSSNLLSKDGHTVTSIGSRLPSSMIHHIRGMMLFCTSFNVPLSCVLWYHIINNRPDIIRRHSVVRYVWRLPIYLASWYNIPMMMMYHDLWYFHPYPSLVTNISQLVQQWNLKQWIQAWTKVWRWSIHHIILMTLKYWSLSLIRSILIKHITLHLVPSDYMIPIVTQRWVPKNRISVLWHFGRIDESL